MEPDLLRMRREEPEEALVQEVQEQAEICQRPAIGQRRGPKLPGALGAPWTYCETSWRRSAPGVGA